MKNTGPTNHLLEQMVELAKEMRDATGSQTLIEAINCVYGNFIEQADYEKWDKNFRANLWHDLELVKKILSQLEIISMDMEIENLKTDLKNAA